MFVKRTAQKVVAHAPAKINLFLEVLGKRPDGYHEISTLMVAVGLYDTLECEVGDPGEVSLRCSDASLSTGLDNLVVKAATLLKEHTGCSKGASLNLEKRIPMQAGLGGGSSDAAAALLVLNEFWKLGLDVRELMILAAKLGSDVPFFLHGPAAWCTGRGEKVEPVSMGRVLHLVLLCPAFGCSTVEVYRRSRSAGEPRTGNSVRQAVAEGDVESVGGQLFNRLQAPAIEVAPGLENYLALLQTFAPAGCLMSGSGSTLFALCKTASQAQSIASSLEPGKDYKVYVVTSCS